MVNNARTEGVLSMHDRDSKYLLVVLFGDRGFPLKE